MKNRTIDSNTSSGTFVIDEGIVFSSKEGSASSAADDPPTTSVSFLLDESSTTESTPVKKEYSKTLNKESFF